MTNNGHTGFLCKLFVDTTFYLINNIVVFFKYFYYAVVVKKIEEDPQIRIEGSNFKDYYNLLQFHFHWGYNNYHGNWKIKYLL